MLTFQTEKVMALREEIEPLLEQHWAEIACDKELMKLDPNWEAYAQIEAAGALHCTTVRADGELVGYAIYFVVPNLHYRNVRVADSDIFWLAPAQRKGMTGIKLIKAAEKTLAGLGVGKIIHKVKLHNDVGRVFERMGYTAFERHYWKTVER